MSTKVKKEVKAKNSKEEQSELRSEITTAAELKTFLLNVRDRMAEKSAAAVYAVAALNNALSSPKIYELLDNQNKEIARDIWLRLRQAGFQLRSPPILFSADETGIFNGQV